MSVPFALTIAGSDPSGGAGIQIDLETFRSCGVQGLSILTAVTAQTQDRFRALYALPRKIVALQWSSLMEEPSIGAAKTGLLFKKQIIEFLVSRLRENRNLKVIVDPVMIATRGAVLMQPGALPALKRLVSLCEFVTPNLYEAGRLAGFTVKSFEDMRRAARILRRMGARQVLIKGGHYEGDPVDLFFDGDKYAEFSHERIVRPGGFHGLGCRLSAALCAYLAQGESPRQAVEHAEAFMVDQIKKI